MRQPCSLLTQILAKSGIQFTTFRISQITGGFPNGAWATTDWISVVLKSSLALGVFPAFAGVSDVELSMFFHFRYEHHFVQTMCWLPMHAVAKAIVETAFSHEAPPAALNLFHPRPVLGYDLFSWVRDETAKAIPGPEGYLNIVPITEWLALLAERSEVVDPKLLVSCSSALPTIIDNHQSFSPPTSSGTSCPYWPGVIGPSAKVVATTMRLADGRLSRQRKPKLLVKL